jgi:hypothetical protein
MKSSSNYWRKIERCQHVPGWTWNSRILTDYTLDYVKSTSIMSLSLKYPKTLGTRMFVLQISLLVVTFLSLISWILSILQITQEVNPHPRIALYVNIWSVTFLFFFICHLLNVGACVCHIAWEGQVEWTTPHHTTPRSPLKCCTLCYSLVSYTTLIL